MRLWDTGTDQGQCGARWRHHHCGLCNPGRGWQIHQWYSCSNSQVFWCCWLLIEIFTLIWPLWGCLLAAVVLSLWQRPSFVYRTYKGEAYRCTPSSTGPLSVLTCGQQIKPWMSLDVQHCSKDKQEKVCVINLLHWLLFPSTNMTLCVWLLAPFKRYCWCKWSQSTNRKAIGEIRVMGCCFTKIIR